MRIHHLVLLLAMIGTFLTPPVQAAGTGPGILILDVRTRGEFQQGHCPHAINLPLDRLEEFAALGIPKETTVLVYCLSGARSGVAARQLRRAGYTNAENVGGLRDMALRARGLSRNTLLRPIACCETHQK